MRTERERERDVFESTDTIVAEMDRLEEVISKTQAQVASAAEAGIDFFLEYRDQHGYDEDTARAKALLEVAEGARAIQDISEMEADDGGD